MNELVLPNDTNTFGDLMGGKLMYWMDIAAYLSAAKHSNSSCMTASVDNLSFKTPIKLGNVICIEARVTRSFTRPRRGADHPDHAGRPGRGRGDRRPEGLSQAPTPVAGVLRRQAAGVACSSGNCSRRRTATLASTQKIRPGMSPAIIISPNWGSDQRARWLRMKATTT